MRLLGAQVTIVPSDNGKQTEKLTREMIREAHAIAEKTGACITAQMENTHQLQAYAKLADEIWEQTGGKIDAFVQSCGTSACLRGAPRRTSADTVVTASALWRSSRPNVQFSRAAGPVWLA
jgi:cysteine synthase A